MIDKAKFITVFTPTFNRADLLKKCYESLLTQNYKNFEWLIIDDGSTDDTVSVVNEISNVKKMNIRYFYKENGGKHSAINFGVNNANSNIFFLLDSDDVLSENSLELINQNWKNVESEQFCGITGLSKYKDGAIIGDRFLNNYWEVSFADVYLKYGLKGDKAVCFKTDILKQYPFPEKENIRFVFEAVVWHEMAKKYNVLALNEVFQVKEYLKQGLTDSSYKKWYVRSLAFSYFNLIKNKTYSFQKYPKAYFWNFIYLGINSRLSKTSYFEDLNSWEKIMYLIFYPRAYYSYINMKNLMKDDE